MLLVINTLDAYIFAMAPRFFIPLLFPFLCSIAISGSVPKQTASLQAPRHKQFALLRIFNFSNIVINKPKRLITGLQI